MVQVQTNSNFYCFIRVQVINYLDNFVFFFFFVTDDELIFRNHSEFLLRMLKEYISLTRYYRTVQLKIVHVHLSQRSVHILQQSS